MMFAQIRSDLWDYQEGNLDMSISTSRYEHIWNLSMFEKGDFKLALKDPEGGWSTWKPFPGGFKSLELRNAIDVHRSVLPFEIVAESDYPTYEENAEAMRLHGKIIEHQGLRPAYYYSGGKGIHEHIYFDFKCLLATDLYLQNKVLEKFETRESFVKAFMEWLRGKVIRCWDTGVRTLDPQLIKSTHLIRSELSRHKVGYKTFLGYSYRDISPIPYVCNEENRIYPQLGKVRLSGVRDPQALLEEFLDSMEKKVVLSKIRHRENSLAYWVNPEKYTRLRPVVEFLLSDSFKVATDGWRRAAFIIANEIRRLEGHQAATDRLREWNNRMGGRLRGEDLAFVLDPQKPEYHLSDEYLNEFLGGLGIALDTDTQSLNTNV
jgi:hypothetical protein